MNYSIKADNKFNGNNNINSGNVVFYINNEQDKEIERLYALIRRYRLTILKLISNGYGKEKRE